MAKLTFKGLWAVLKDAFSGFSEHKIPKLAASLAYYTVFSIGPLLLVIISVAGLVLGREAIEGSLYSQLDEFVGHEAAVQIQDIVKNASVDGKSTISLIIGIAVLLLGATTMFAELQDSINTIWGLKQKPKQGIWVTIKTRLLSFGIVGVLAFLLLVSLAVSAVISGLSDRLQQLIPGVGAAVMLVINMAITLGITTVLFAVIFKVLPDAEIRWKDVWPGAIATSILFLIGKFAISFYIGQSDVASTYGAAGSMVIMLLWIYYSSIILYFGAEFTRAYDMKYAEAIRPNKYAMVVKPATVEGEHATLQEAHEEKMQEQQDQPKAEPKKAEPKHVPRHHKEEDEVPQPKKTPLPARKAEPTTIIYETAYPKQGQKGKAERASDGLYRIRIEKKKPTGIATALAGLALFFVNTALDQSRELKGNR